MKFFMKYILSLVLIFSLFNSFISKTVFGKEPPNESGIYITLDSENFDSLPKNFRKTTDLSKVENGKGNLNGLQELNISGSAQFTSLSLINMKKNINTKNEFWDIDLRQESHGFVNGSAISWYGPGNKANRGLTLNEVIVKEVNQLSSIPFGKPLSIDRGKYTLLPTVVENEDKLVSSNNIKYLRITVTDGDRPTDDLIDLFVDFVTKIPSNTWLHFHCKEGTGRTTTFMALYDMMKNSKEVSLDDMIQRQFLLGGFNLFKPGDEDPRAIFLKNFYNYAKENNDNFKTTWSQWIEKNNIQPYTLQNELPTK